MIFSKKMAYASLVLVFFATFLACKKGKDSPSEVVFDQKAMLQNYAEALVQPAYRSVQSEIAVLAQRWEQFKTNPTPVLLDSLRQDWANTYETWQFANGYNFGPAGEQGFQKGLAEEIGTFPVDSSKIEDFIAAGDLSLNNAKRDTRGFLAIEYLLFGEAKGSLLDNTARRDYLNTLLYHLKERVEQVVSSWDMYRESFISSTGTDVGSSTAVLYNEFVRIFEHTKNFKVGLPAGKRPGQTQPEPQLTEAYFSGKSYEMLKAQLSAIEGIYKGRSRDGKDGIGLRDYVEKSVGGAQLVADTEAQWQKVILASAAVPTDRPLSALVAEGHPAVDALHTELQKQTRFFKSDMSSLLGIAITFSSSDGD
jgi:uncharacterized protein